MNEGNEGIIAIHQTDAFQKCCGAIKYMETNAHKYEDPQLDISWFKAFKRNKLDLTQKKSNGEKVSIRTKTRK